MNDNNTPATEQKPLAGDPERIPENDPIFQAIKHFSSISAYAEHCFIRDFLTLCRTTGILSAEDLRHFSEQPKRIEEIGEQTIWLHYGKDQLAILRSSFYIIERAVRFWAAARKAEEAKNAARELKRLL